MLHLPVQLDYLHIGILEPGTNESPGASWHAPLTQVETFKVLSADFFAIALYSNKEKKVN